MTNLDSILKSRDIIWLTKVHLVKAMVFPVVIMDVRVGPLKKAERRRTDVFEPCWRRLLRVPWTAKKSNQSILKKISPDYSLVLMLKLKLQYIGHSMRRTSSLKKTLMLGKTDSRRDDRGWDRWMASLTRWTRVWSRSASWSWWWTGKPGVPQSTGSQRVGHDWATELKWAPHKDSDCSYLEDVPGHRVLSCANLNMCHLCGTLVFRLVRSLGQTMTRYTHHSDCAFCIPFSIIPCPVFLFHFVEGKPEVLRGKMTYTRSHHQQVEKLRFKLKHVFPQHTKLTGTQNMFADMNIHWKQKLDMTLRLRNWS